MWFENCIWLKLCFKYTNDIFTFEYVSKVPLSHTHTHLHIFFFIIVFLSYSMHTFCRISPHNKVVDNHSHVHAHAHNAKVSNVLVSPFHRVHTVVSLPLVLAVILTFLWLNFRRFHSVVRSNTHQNDVLVVVSHTTEQWKKVRSEKIYLNEETYKLAN